MEILRQAGLSIETLCSGSCQCATCHVFLEEPWLSRLKPKTEFELATLEGEGSEMQANLRLACQIRCQEDLSERDEDVCVDIFRNIMRVRHQMHKIASGVAEKSGLHAAELNVVAILGKFGPISMGLLSHETFISPSNTTNTVKKLELAGLVSKEEVRQFGSGSQRRPHRRGQGTISQVLSTYPRRCSYAPGRAADAA